MTPAGVPVETISPGLRVIHLESNSISFGKLIELVLLA